MNHKSDLITIAGLKRIREYCDNPNCCECKIGKLCNIFTFDRKINKVPRCWTDSDITAILKVTRNYMEATSLKDLKRL